MTPKVFRKVIACMLIVIVFLLLTVVSLVLFYKPKQVVPISCAIPSTVVKEDIEPKQQPIVIVMDSGRAEANKYQKTNEANEVDIRDRRVIADPLYPPLNRSDKMTHQSLLDSQVFNYKTDGLNDSFRLIGYLTNNDIHHTHDAGGNSWKLFGRMRDRHQGEYYIVPSNNNYDIKIPLTPDVMNGVRLKDVYTLPNEMSFNSPLLNRSAYLFTEIPKSDLSDMRYS